MCHQQRAQKGINMTTTKKATSKYTPAMEAAIRAAAPLNLAKAAQLAETADFVKAGVFEVVDGWRDVVTCWRNA